MQRGVMHFKETSVEWEEAADYSAMIGGIIYKNVKNPVVVNGKSLITFTRNSSSNTLAASLQIQGDDGQLIAVVENNHVKLLDDGFHIGVDAKSDLTHSLETTAANEHDLNQVGNLLHGKEEFVFADAGYQGAENREELTDVEAEWVIAMRPGKLKELKKQPVKTRR